MSATDTGNPKEQGNLLPESSTLAVKTISDVVKELVEVMDKEAHALIMNDGIALTSLDAEKDQLSVKYEQMAKEFRARGDEFKSVDNLLIGQLEKLQTALAEKTQTNMDTMDRIRAEKIIKGEIRVSSPDED